MPKKRKKGRKGGSKYLRVIAGFMLLGILAFSQATSQPAVKINQGSKAIIALNPTNMDQGSLINTNAVYCLGAKFVAFQFLASNGSCSTAVIHVSADSINWRSVAGITDQIGVHDNVTDLAGVGDSLRLSATEGGPRVAYLTTHQPSGVSGYPSIIWKYCRVQVRPTSQGTETSVFAVHNLVATAIIVYDTAVPLPLPDDTKIPATP
jgi:hypothetical protein